ncbi:MAG: co-chaperone GroES [Acidobacteria bacterium]|nr:co-chaperone GroES [Acidobacteriota bacterium]
MTTSSSLEQISVLFDRVLVIIDDDGERRSRAGILIPATAQIARRLSWARVVAVGPHVRTVRVGDRVLYATEERYELDIDGEDYVLLRERDLHVVKRDADSQGTGLYL